MAPQGNGAGASAHFLSQTPAFARLGSAAVREGGDYSKSWMLPEAKHEDLLYATDNSYEVVDVFSYPAGRKVGTLEVGGEPFGECVDKAGDVWITRFRTTSVVEYAHGSKTEIGIVSTYPNNPFGCSIDPTTGNLAVTNTEGSVGVYANAQGSPTLYTVQGDDYGFTFCTYDDSGNLFATAPYSQIAELPKGSSEMTNLQLDFSINPWSIQWDERRKYLAVAGSTNKGEPTSIYHVGVSGTTGRLIGTTLLRRSNDGYPPQFWIKGAEILGPVVKRVESWPYPAGGKPTKVAHVWRHGPGSPDLYGVVVSEAKK
ncbi:MAG: hypothetical protein WA431_07385 [Candidatus Cybelea sp.]